MYNTDDKNAASALPYAGLYCLVAEDNPFALDIMTIFLSRQGFSVDGAENGQVAVERYLASPGRYSAIFMDLQMPVMGGYEAARNIRGGGLPDSAAIPIIAMSGDPLDNLCDLGFSRQLRKPFEMQTVLTLLGELLPCPCNPEKKE